MIPAGTGTFTWRLVVIIAVLAGLTVGTSWLYTATFIDLLQAQAAPAFKLPVRSGQLIEDSAIMVAITRNTERVDQLSNRVSSLEALRPDSRISVLESKIDTQSKFIQVIFAAAIAQLFAWLGKGVSWLSETRSKRSAPPSTT